MNNRTVAILVILVLIVSALAYDRHMVEKGQVSPVGTALDFLGIAKFFSWHQGGKKVIQDKIGSALQDIRDEQKQIQRQRVQLTETFISVLQKLKENNEKINKETTEALKFLENNQPEYVKTEKKFKDLQMLAKHSKTLEREYTILGENTQASEDRLIDQWERLDSEFASAIQFIEETTQNDLLDLMGALNKMWNEQQIILENLEINWQRLQAELLLNDSKATECFLAIKASEGKELTEYFNLYTEDWRKRNRLINDLEANETELILNLRNTWKIDWDFMIMVSRKVSLESHELIKKCQDAMGAVDQTLNTLLNVRKADLDQFKKYQDSFFETLNLSRPSENNLE